MKKNYLILTGLFASALAWSSGELCAQNKQLKGRIIGRETGEVLSGATVRTNRGRHTLSDTQGRYSLEADRADTLLEGATAKTNFATAPCQYKSHAVTDTRT